VSASVNQPHDEVCLGHTHSDAATSLCLGVISTFVLLTSSMQIQQLREPLDIVPSIACVHDPIAGPWEVDTLPTTVDSEARRF
jgi:hypothetical protein